MLSDERHCN